VRKLAILSLVSLVLLAGCDNDFLANEQDIQSGSKTRPLAIICDPPEAVPGQEVTITLRFYEPDPAAVSVSWQAVLDYNVDLYNDIETEEEIVDLSSISAPTFDDNNIGEQSFNYTVPENILLISSGLDEIFTEPVPNSIRDLIQPANADYLTKREINTFLATVDPATLDAEVLAWCREFSDYFASEIRFRADIESNVKLDITKNLTVRYSGKFSSDNVNQNQLVRWIGIISIHEPDVEEHRDIEDYDCDTTYVYHENQALISTEPIPAHADWTYWIFAQCDYENYVSPAGNEHRETIYYSWYFLRPDPNASDDLFYGDAREKSGTDEGEETQIQPPLITADENLHIFLVARDFRWEWDMYHATPGVTYMTVPVEFVVQD